MIKYFGSSWIHETLDVIFETWIYDLRDKRMEMAKEDAKAWFMLNNAATLFSTMMSRTSKKPDFRFKSINELMPEIKSEKEIDKENKEWDNFSLRADKLANMWKKQ